VVNNRQCVTLCLQFIALSLRCSFGQSRLPLSPSLGVPPSSIAPGQPHSSPLDRHTTMQQPGMGMGDAEFERLLERVRSNTCTNLSFLDTDRLSAPQFVQLCRVLEKNSSVRTVYLDVSSSWIVGFESGRALGDMLAANCGITQLSLWNIPADASFVADLARGLQRHPTLEALELRRPVFTPTSGQAIFAALQHCPQLGKLRLDYCALEETSASALAALLHALPRLNKLVLISLSPSGASVCMLIAALSNHATLRSLVLGCERFEAAEMRCLAEMLTANRSITELRLAFDKQADTELARELRSQVILGSLALFGAPFASKIGAAAGTQLADALRSNTTLTTLFHYGIELSADDEQSLADSLQRNKQLAAAQVRRAATSEQQPLLMDGSKRTTAPCVPDPEAVSSHPAAAADAATAAATAALAASSVEPSDDTIRQQGNGGWALEGPSLPTDEQLQQMKAEARFVSHPDSDSDVNGQAPQETALPLAGGSQGQEQSPAVDWSQRVTEPAVPEQQASPVDWSARVTEPAVPELSPTCAPVSDGTMAAVLSEVASSAQLPAELRMTQPEPAQPLNWSPTLQRLALTQAVSSQPFQLSQNSVSASIAAAPEEWELVAASASPLQGDGCADAEVHGAAVSCALPAAVTDSAAAPLLAAGAVTAADAAPQWELAITEPCMPEPEDYAAMAQVAADANNCAAAKRTGVPVSLAVAASAPAGRAELLSSSTAAAAVADCTDSDVAAEGVDSASATLPSVAALPSGLRSPPEAEPTVTVPAALLAAQAQRLQALEVEMAALRERDAARDAILREHIVTREADLREREAAREIAREAAARQQLQLELVQTLLQQIAAARPP